MGQKRISKKRIKSLLADLDAEIAKVSRVWSARDADKSPRAELNRATAKMITEPMRLARDSVAKATTIADVEKIIRLTDELYATLYGANAQSREVSDTKRLFDSAVAQVRLAGLTAMTQLLKRLTQK